MECIQRLTEFVDMSGIDLFLGEVTGVGSDISGFCDLLYSAIELCQALAMSSETQLPIAPQSPYFLLLHKTIPKAIEIICKRRTEVEHESCVMDVLRSFTKLCATQLAQVVGEMCVTRNIVLLGSNNLTFISAAEITGKQKLAAPVDTGINFAVTYGKPSSAYLGGKLDFFWRDEWQSVLGGSSAVGHHISYYHDNREWYSGVITRFDSSTGRHTICLQESAAQPALSYNLIEVCIDDALPRIQWTDSEILSNLQNKDTHNFRRETSTENGEKLSFSFDDEGKYLAIWWTRYQRNIYGKIQSYHIQSGEHKIIYQDGEIKMHNMKEKIYEILHPPDALTTRLTVDSPHAAAAVVATWHLDALRRSRENSVTVHNKAKYVSDEFLDVPVDPNIIAVRGIASSLSCSMFQIDLINTFYRSGGFETIFKSYSTDISQHLCVSKIISDMRLGLNLRKVITVDAFQEICWTLKECIPFAMEHFSDEQTKELSPTLLSDIVSLLRDLVMAHQPNSVNIGTTLELFLLQIGLHLLRCSQLQKRFWGVSIICDRIENVVPSVAKYLRRQGGTPGCRQTSGQRQPSDFELARLRAQQRADLSPTLLSQWILKFDPLKVIFIHSFHQDLCSRSEAILVFLAMHRLLKTEHLDAVWSAASGGRHEAVVRVMHKLVLRIIPILEPKLRAHLFSLLSAVPFSEYSEQSLHLLKSFTVATLAAVRTEDMAGSAAILNRNSGKNEHNLNETTWRIVDPSSSALCDNDTQGGGAPRHCSAVNSRKGQVISAPSRPWLGMGLLWAFVQDPDVQYSKETGAVLAEEGLIDTAVHLLVELLTEEFRHEREVIMQKCIENIHNSVSVASSLKILRLVFMSFRSSSKGWFGRGSSKDNSLCAVLESMNEVVGGSIVDMVLSELDSYLLVFQQHLTSLLDFTWSPLFLNSESQADAAIDNMRITVNGRLCLIPHLQGIKERLTFIRFILSDSALVLTDDHVQQLWNLLIVKAFSVKTIDVCMEWFDSLLVIESKHLNRFLKSLIQDSTGTDSVKIVSSSESVFSVFAASQAGENALVETSDLDIFAPNVSLSLLEKCMIPWARTAKWGPLSRLPVASVCFKLFLSVNIKFGMIHVSSSDGKWHRSGKLMGLQLLWYLAADCSVQAVYEAAMHLLIELHYRLHGNKPKAGEENTRDIFLRRCFGQLTVLVQTNAESSHPDHSALDYCRQEGAIELEKVENPVVVSSRMLRYLSMLMHFFKRFDADTAASTEVPKSTKVKSIVIRLLGGISETFLVEIVGKPDDTVGMLREKIADHLQDSISAFSIERKLKSGGSIFSVASPHYELLDTDKDSTSLRDLKFSSKGEVIVVKRVSHTMKQSVKNNEVSRNPDLITVKDLTSVYLQRLSGHPLEWLGLSIGQGASQEVEQLAPSKIQGGMHRSTSNASLSTSAHSMDGSSGKFGVSVSKTSCYVFELPRLPLSNHSGMVIPTKATHTKSGSNNSQISSSLLHDYLALYLTGKSEYFDLLLNMLDGFISVELHRMGSIGIEISRIAWEVIQHLPCDLSILSRVCNLSQGSASVELNDDRFLRELLDVQSPHRLMYTLQVIDAITDMERVDNSTRVPAIRKWCLEFISLGGAEFLLEIGKSKLNSLKTILKSANIISELVTSPDGNRDSSQKCFVQSDIVCLTCALIFRIIHRLLCFDPCSSPWTLPPQPVDILKESEIDRSAVPAGVLVALCDAPRLIPSILSCLLSLSIACYDKSIAPSEQHVCAMVEHSIFLVLTLCCSAQGGIDILRGYTDWHRLLRSVCIRNPFDAVRKGACRRIVDFNYRFFYVTSFNARNGDMDVSTSKMDSDNTLQQIDLFRYIFKSMLLSAHPSFDNQSDVGIQRAPESYLLSELYYSAVAAMWALQCSPRAIMNSVTAKSGETFMKPLKLGNHYPGRRGNSELDPTNGVAMQTIGMAFVEKLFTHQSTESFHSDKSDQTLVGVLRVILTMAKMDQSARRLFGHCHAQVKINEFGKKIARVFVLSSSNKSLDGFMPDVADENDLKIDLRNVDDSIKTESLLFFLMYKCLNPPHFAVITSPVESCEKADVTTPVVSSQSQQANPALAHAESTSNAAVEIFGAYCQTDKSKTLAYSLICELCCDDQDNLSIFLDSIQRDGLFSLNQADSCTPIVNNRPCEMSQKIDHPNKVRYMWDYNPSALVKSPGQCVGLVNQGATCYMNALLQQLFQVQRFSEGIMAIEWDDLRNFLKEDCKGDEANAAADVIFQLQVTFGYLKLSQKRYYDARSFCAAFRDYDGQPLRLSEQKDINEFASMLFDKLDCNKKSAEVLNGCFGGRLVYQIISMESAYRSEREEAFNIITVEMQNKDTLEEALELFVAGERLSDDNKILDESENRKVEAVRRCTIRALPNTLIIHLKRFEFDLRTMERKKINDKLSFPFELNMFPYTEEGVMEREEQLRARADFSDSGLHGTMSSINEEELIGSELSGTQYPDGNKSSITDTSILNTGDDYVLRENEIVLNDMSSPQELIECKKDIDAAEGGSKNMRCSAEKLKMGSYQYSLTGIVAHVGAIDSGHYYSFVKDRGTGIWREFNDRSVLPFSDQSIPRECFGGVDEEPSPAGLQTNTTTQKIREYNAYLLVYDRVKMLQPADLDNQNNGASPANASNMFSVSEDAGDALTSNLSGFRKVRRHSVNSMDGRISKRVMQVVMKENAEFIKHRNMFDISYFRFIWSFLSCDAVDLLLCRDREAPREDVSLELLSTKSHSKDISISKLVLWILSFCVDVLIHARAHQCVHVYFEKLEEIVIRDKSGVAAASILREVGTIPPVCDRLPLNMYRVLLGDLGSAPSSAHPGHRASRLATEIASLESFCHPWLLETCLLCPDMAITTAFVRLLLVSLKVLLPHGAIGGYLELNEDEDDKPYIESGCLRNRYHSPVASALDALITLVEQFRLDHIYNKNGYIQVTSLLFNYASLGAEERNILIKLGAVNRLAISVMSLKNQTSPGHSLESVAYATGVVALLIRGSTSSTSLVEPQSVPESDVISDGRMIVGHYEEVVFTGTSPTMLLQETFDGVSCSSLLQLSKNDITAFLSTTYLEGAINSNFEATVLALKHVCCCNRDAEIARKILESVSSLLFHELETPVNPQRGTSINFRPYLRIISGLLLLIMDSHFSFKENVVLKRLHSSILLAETRRHEKYNRDELSIKKHLFQEIVGPLLVKCDYLSGNWKRYTVVVAEYINELCNMLLLIGTTGRDGHDCALLAREWWQKSDIILKKISSAKFR